MESIQVVLMDKTEAQSLVKEINKGIATVGGMLADLLDREGWRALGYESWRDCCMAEFEFSQSRIYQLLNHQRVIKNISADSTIVEKPTNESQTRPLQKLTALDQAQAWRNAQAKGGRRQPTGKQVAQVVRGISKADQLQDKGKRVYTQEDRQAGPGIDSEFEESTAVFIAPDGQRFHLSKLDLIELLGELDNGLSCPYCENRYK